MAFLCVSTFPTTSLSPLSPLSSKPPSHRFKVSCNASSDDHPKTSESPNLILPMQNNNVDRRNLLLGLGGLYGTANMTNIGSALAYTVTAPDDISDCVPASSLINNLDDVVRGVACCPPPSPAFPKPYVLPSFRALRVRRPAHKLTPEYIEKYKAAIAAMKALHEDHPHSWKQQGKIHCAYCDGAYHQQLSENQKVEVKVHFSSIFYPFHRWYLYFYERILGKLINDPSFALPYWNWDNPMGMMLPAMFEAPGPDNDLRTNPLFDPYRNVSHAPPAIVDLQFDDKEHGRLCVDQVSINLCSLHTQMVRTRRTDDFFGCDPDPKVSTCGGSIENGAHTAVHRWMGNPRMANHEDLGNFYSAGYDPVFYVHHANVDRMWHIWMGLKGKRKGPSSTDWMNSSYVFYDENEELVRVYNRDCVNMRRMGYMYEASSIPWKESPPIPRVKASKVALKSVRSVKKAEETEFPVKLDKRVNVLVKRPATTRSEDEKENFTEMLVLNGIKFNSEKFFKFDVLVNDVDNGIQTTATSSEFAGTFAQVPHMPGHKMFITSGASYGITEVLEDLEAEEDGHVLVTLVPRAGTEEATVSEIKIELLPID
ncbi:putative catechol oxidase [Helianthus anomalus]